MEIPSSPLLNFTISSSEKISAAFIERRIFTFHEALDFVGRLPYRRNKNKEDVLCVLVDGYGTCSSKHALLKRLAIENNADTVKLWLGIFKMNRHNMPAVEATLAKYKLDFIPEAHNYLLVNNEIVDCTGINVVKEDFINDLIVEIEIQPDQITEFKVAFHKNLLENWLKENQRVPYTLTELYAIREECISALQNP